MIYCKDLKVSEFVLNKENLTFRAYASPSCRLENRVTELSSCMLSNSLADSVHFRVLIQNCSRQNCQVSSLLVRPTSPIY